jgi:hypothetical protein
MIYAPDLIIIIICVDDLIFGSKSQRAIDRYEMEIQLRFDMEDIIEYGHYLGIRITTTKQYSSLKKHTFNDSFNSRPEHQFDYFEINTLNPKKLNYASVRSVF